MKSLLVLPLAFLFLFTPSTARACSCERQTPCEAFTKASAVFIGRMMGGTEKVKDNSGKVTGLEAGMVRFSIEEVFKGSIGREVQISVASMTGTSCGPYGLYPGQRYLVYAHSVPNSNRLSTGVCTRTTQVSEGEPKQEVDFLRNLPAAGSGGKLYGQVLGAEKDGSARVLPGVTVVATDEDNKSARTITNDKGEFEFRSLRAGRYKVATVWPGNYIGRVASVEITVIDRGCVRASFEAEVRGRGK